jgi:hypothetical protein
MALNHESYAALDQEYFASLVLIGRQILWSHHSWFSTRTPDFFATVEDMEIKLSVHALIALITGVLCSRYSPVHKLGHFFFMPTVNQELDNHLNSTEGPWGPGLADPEVAGAIKSLVRLHFQQVLQKIRAQMVIDHIPHEEEAYDFEAKNFIPEQG